MINKKQFKAIIFDVDGTIADTERYGHLPASNDAMEQLGLDIVWNWETFSGWINTIPGTKNRLIYSLEQRGFAAKDITYYAEQFPPLKKSIYINNYLPTLKLREGVVNMLEEIIATDIQLAIVSTSYEAQIKALLQSQLPQFYPYFNPILGKESGKKTENNGFLFKKCLQLLNIQATEAIVIEDSQSGLEAAICAHIPTAIFYNDYTKGSSFDGATIIAPSMANYSLQQLIDSMKK